MPGGVAEGRGLYADPGLDGSITPRGKGFEANAGSVALYDSRTMG